MSLTPVKWYIAFTEPLMERLHTIHRPLLNLPNKMRNKTNICSPLLICNLNIILISKIDYNKYRSKCNNMILQGSVISSDCKFILKITIAAKHICRCLIEKEITFVPFYRSWMLNLLLNFVWCRSSLSRFSKS